MDGDLFEEQQYALNKMFLWFSGIWPYQRSKLWRRILVLAVVMSIIIAQIIKVIVEWHRDMDTAIQIIPACLTSINSLAQYLNSIINEAKMRELLNHIKRDCDKMMRLPQKVLMINGSMEGRKITVFYSTYISVLVMLYLLMPLGPIVLDIVQPLNETRKRKLLYDVEFFVDNQEYYYQIMLHECISTFLVIDILLAHDTMFLVFVQHACTLFMILSNQLKYLHIMEDEYIDEEKIKQLEHNYNSKMYTQMEYCTMYKKLKRGVQLHKSILSFSKLLQSSFTTAFAVQVFLNVLGISLTGIQLIINLNSFDDLTRYCSLITGQLVHLFFLCFSGQRLMDYSLQAYYDICSSMWYLFPKNTQNIYKFLLMQSSCPSKITAGKFATMNMETFLSVVRTAMSYFTVLSSVR